MKKILIALIMAISVTTPIQTMAESVTQSEVEIKPSEQNIEQIIDEITSEPYPINSDAIQNAKEYIIKYFGDLGYDNIECQKFEYNDENNENAIRRSSQVDVFLAPTAENATIDGTGENIIVTKKSSTDMTKNLIIMGGVWLCSQSYEYFRYSEDLKTLKNKIYPSLRGSVLFCLDWMQQREDGLYYTAPSTSPENTFEDDEGHSCGVSYMTTMDLAIIKELFANYLAAADVLGIEEDLIKLVKERSKLLPGYQIGKTGMIQEWIKDFEKSDVGHRHFSPVFGFHPGHSIKKTDTELVQACQNFIEEKAENFKQQIGWSCAWLINLWARLGDGTKANHYYEELLRQSVYDNLFDLHPPLGETEGEREVFQIDGNFGSASGVAEMLISSEKGKITILPALPDSWKNGKVRGLLAAGAIEVDITWKDRKPVSVSLRSSSDQNVSLFYRNRKLAEQIELKKQEQQIINLCSC